MTRDEIVTALRCCVSAAPDCCKTCHAAQEDGCEDAIARRDKQIEDMKQGMAQLAKAVAVKEEMEWWND